MALPLYLAQCMEEHGHKNKQPIVLDTKQPYGPSTKPYHDVAMSIQQKVLNAVQAGIKAATPRAKPDKLDLANVKCWRCQQYGHFAHSCPNAGKGGKAGKGRHNNNKVVKGKGKQKNKGWGRGRGFTL